MSLLTENDIGKITWAIPVYADESQRLHEFASAIEAAVIAHLATVSVEPFAWALYFVK